MLSQSETAKLLERCVEEECPELAMEEVLSAYVAWKFIRGQNCALVMQKLRYLALYLRVTERRWLLERMSEVLIVIGTEISFGGGLIGACPVSTSIGKQVWNEIRRKLNPNSYMFKTDPEFGGPITFHRLRSIDEPRNPVRDFDGDILPESTTDNTPSRTNTTGLTADSLRTTFSTGVAATISSPVNSPDPSTSGPHNHSRSRWSLASLGRRRQGVVRDETHWSERPRWIRLWFLTRPHLAGQSNMLQMLVPEYISLVPPYTSFRGTLPLYLSDHSRSTRRGS
ncbi:hypothetical protein FB446DRAFT_692560 [Lentinula raphanica]|nr:hypothetical protein FB446DRAFT_692560 [Lentinula raphanica]